MGLIVDPGDFDPDDPTTAALVNERFKRVYDLLNGLIDAANISPTADIPGSALAAGSVEPDRLSNPGIVSSALQGMKVACGKVEFTVPIGTGTYVADLGISFASGYGGDPHFVSTPIVTVAFRAEMANVVYSSMETHGPSIMGTNVQVVCTKNPGGAYVCYIDWIAAGS
jgi:hypothetical protein